MTIDGDEVQFSTGRTLHANGGIIGIGPFGDDDITEGYDGSLVIEVRSNAPVDTDYLTREECQELADHMIARWERFRESCASKRYCV